MKKQLGKKAIQHKNTVEAFDCACGCTCTCNGCYCTGDQSQKQSIASDAGRSNSSINTRIPMGDRIAV